MNDRGADGVEPLRHLNELPVAMALLAKLDFPKDDLGAGNLLSGRNHLSGAGNDLLAELIGRPAVEDDAMRFLEFLRDYHRHGDRIAYLRALFHRMSCSRCAAWRFSTLSVSADDVITRVDVLDVARERSGAVADEESSEVAYVFDAHEPMLRRAGARPLKKLVKPVDARGCARF